MLDRKVTLFVDTPRTESAGNEHSTTAVRRVHINFAPSIEGTRNEYVDYIIMVLEDFFDGTETRTQVKITMLLLFVVTYRVVLEWRKVEF